MLEKANDKKLNQEKKEKLNKNDVLEPKKNKKVTKKETSQSTKSTKTTKTTTSSSSSKNVKKNSKKSPTKKTSNSKTTKSNTKKRISKLEYYDLPYSYNKTIVKILAQTPFCLFVYWEISENDKKNLQKAYGDNIFNISKPYLQITNESMNYTFEVEVNDYANSWYVNIKDSNSKYKVTLIRKLIVSKENNTPLENAQKNNSTIYISSSNEMQAPNDHILFDKLGKTVFFKNVKTNVVESKNIASLSFLNNVGQIYNIYELYQKIYSNELEENKFELNLSSSSSSTFR